MDTQPKSKRGEEGRARIEAKMTLSNEALSESDGLIVRDLLKEAIGELEYLDAEILRLQTELNNVQANRLKTHSRIRMFQSTAYRKLPPELLLKIFRYCHDGVVKLPPKSSQDIWAIIQVCSKWREVALMDSQLWREIYIASNIPPTSYPMEALIHDILSYRGGQGPIIYHVAIKNHIDWQQLLNLTWTYRSRLRGLDLRLSATCNTNEFKMGSRIAMNNPHHSPLPVHNQTTFHPDKNNSWGHLTHLNLLRPKIPFLVLILCHCSQLITCIVRDAKDSEPEETSTQPIILEHLRSMVFKRCEGRNVRDFLGRLVLPSLKTLECGVMGWSTDLILTMIMQSGCLIEEFLYDGHSLMVSGLPDLLQAMPSLLRIADYRGATIPSSVLDEITKRNLAPKLRRIRGWNISSISPFIELLQSRPLTGNEGISTVEVSITSTRLNPDREYFQTVLPDLIAQGRDIRIYSYPV